MKKFLVATAIGTASLAASASPESSTGTVWGFYVGEAPIYRSLDHKGVTVYVGHRGFSYLDFVHLGGEFQLASFGAAPVPGIQRNAQSINTHSSNVSAILAFDIRRFQVFAKLGVANVTMLIVSGEKNEEKFYESYGPSIGLGGSFKFSENLAARIEWHRNFPIGQQEIDLRSGSRNLGMLAMGLQFMF